MLNDGERQVAPDIGGIRVDHVARYQWAVGALMEKFPARLKRDGTFKKGAVRVLDVGCGIGYGAKLLAEAGCDVLALDREPGAIEYAMEHYAHPNIEYVVEDFTEMGPRPGYHAAVCFEVLEHTKTPGIALDRIRQSVPLVIASVPNEDVYPYRGHILFHERHYTPTDFEELLNECNFEVAEWWGQEDQRAAVEPKVCGRTLVVVAEASRNPKGGTASVVPDPPYRPKRIAIVALGHSKIAYFNAANMMGGNTKQEFDEIWAINSIGGVIKHDRLFHMDDVIVQEERARLSGEVSGILEWLKDHPGPIYTSTTAGDVRDAIGAYEEQLEGLEPSDDKEGRYQKVKVRLEMLRENLPRYEAYPNLVSFPLGEVLVSTGAAYLNNTVAHAMAMAMHMDVEVITLFGADYTYPDAHVSEKGRACVENLIGMCSRMGIAVQIPPESTLMDANAPIEERYYGYDAWDVTVEREEGGALKLTKSAKPIPTAEEMEIRYRKIPKIIEDQIKRDKERESAA